VVVWHATGSVAAEIHTMFVVGWILLIYSLHLSGFGYQTGWTSWSAWLRRRPEPARSFRPRGVYRIMRHPIYFCFLILIWAAPIVTLDRAFLIAIWTLYILVGSYLKDQRLRYYLGGRYRAYQAHVPGYPGLICGPLGRVRSDARALAELKRQSSAKRAVMMRAMTKELRCRSPSVISRPTAQGTGCRSHFHRPPPHVDSRS
jgi:hypothetical protein